MSPNPRDHDRLLREVRRQFESIVPLPAGEPPGSQPPHLDETTARGGGGPDRSWVGRRELRLHIDGYEIIREIGRGGMGVVYEATQLALGRRVALKVLPISPGMVQDELLSRFRREATAAAKLHHTHIVPVYDFGESGHAYYYAMELVQGRPLGEAIRLFAAADAPSASAMTLSRVLADMLGGPESAPGGGSGQASPGSRWDGASSSHSRVYYRQAARWVAEAAEALHYAHQQGIIHRDIKPGNLMLSHDGRIMVLDFGLAKTASEASVTKTGVLLGTLRYMSPEQAMAKRLKVDHRTDIYSLGATFYELLTFRPAFKGDDEKETLGLIITSEPTSPRKFAPRVPRELETICLKCLEKDPAARYATARDLADDLRRFQQDLPIAARPVGPLGRAWKFVRRRRAASLAAAAILLLVAAVVIGGRAVRREAALRAERTARERQVRVEDLLRQGRERWEARDWVACEQRFNEVLQIDPANVVALVNLANAQKDRFYAAHDPALLDAAAALLHRAMTADESQAEAIWNSLGVILRLQNRLDDAIDAHRRATEINPGYYANWVSLANAHAVRGDLAEAEASLKKGVALAGDGGGAMPWHNLAAVQLELGRGEAAASAARALMLSANQPVTMLLQARTCLELDGMVDVRRAVESAITADTQAGAGHRNARIKVVRALAELRAGRFADALESAAQAEEMGDSSELQYLVRAIANSNLNQTEAARTACLAARKARGARPATEGATAVVERGLLWFEPRRAIARLRDEASGSCAGPP